jgi:WD40 repeat protein
VKTRRPWLASTLLLLAAALAGPAADKDTYGDPLPEGAKARLGTARLRVLSYSAPLLTPDGKTLYAQSSAGLLKLDPATGASQGKAPGQLYGTPAVISADGKRAAHVNYDRVTVWETETGKTIAKVERRLPSTDFAASLSADGKTLAIGGIGDRVKKDPVTVIVWDVAADKELKKIAVPQNEYSSVAISSDGKTVATWGSHFDPDAKNPPDPETNPNRFVTFWNVADGKQLSKFRVGGYMPGMVAFSPDSALVAVSSGNGSIDLVDPKTGTSKNLLLGRTRMGRWVAFSPDGTTIAATADDGSVQRWKVADGARLSTTEPPVTGLYNTRVRALSAEKSIAWAGKGSTTVVWEVPSGKLISPAGGHSSPVRGVAITGDIKFAITSADDGTTLKWELATGKPAGTVTLRQPNAGFGGYQPAAIFSQDVTRALVRDPSGGLGIHDLATGTQQYVIPVAYEGASYAAFSADGSKVVVVSSSYDTKKLPARVSVWDVAAAKRAAHLDLPGFGTLSASITPDGKHLVTAARKPAEKGNGEFLVTAWDAATGAKKGEYSEEAGFSTPFVATASDNKTAAVVTARGKLIVFDLAGGKVNKTIDLKNNQPALTPVFSPDGKKLAVICQADYGPTQSAPIHVLDWESGDIKHSFASPGGTPGAAMFSPDGKWLITGSPDTTATVWDVSK